MNETDTAADENAAIDEQAKEADAAPSVEPIEQDAPIGDAVQDEDQPALDVQASGECVAFSVADALIHLGIDANFPSSHVLHATMVGVLFHPDGSVSVGAFVEGRRDKFDRHAAGMLAIANAGTSRVVKAAEAAKLYRS